MILRRIKQTKGIKGKGIVLEYVNGEKVMDWEAKSDSIFEKIAKNGYITVTKLG